MIELVIQLGMKIYIHSVGSVESIIVKFFH